jgi:hypothetical protein
MEPESNGSASAVSVGESRTSGQQAQTMAQASKLSQPPTTKVDGVAIGIPSQPATAPRPEPSKSGLASVPPVQPSKNKTPAISEPPASPLAARTPAGKTETPEPSAEKPAAEKPAENAGPENTERRAAFSRAVTDMRKAMAKRDLATARRQLKTVKTNVQNQADQEQFDRLDIMLDNLQQFWDGLRSSVARLQPPEEIDIDKDTKVAVIEASQDTLVVMYGGRRSFKVDQLPLPLLQALVNQSFAQTSGSKIIVGTFLAIDGEGENRAQAKKLWEDAAKSGTELGKQLLPELNAPSYSGGKKSTLPTKRRR